MVVKTAEKTSLQTDFDTLSARWKKDCEFLSSTSAMIAHSAYQAIIQLGQPVVPLLLLELKKEPAHWFEALKAITGEDPVSPADWGNISAMTAAWLAWGRSRKLV